MILINEDETGLGKPKLLKKIRLRNVSLKNAVKVTKFVAPIATSIVPGGGIASKLLSSKTGKIVSRVAKSKAVRKGIKLSRTKLGRKVVNVVQNRPRPQLEAVSTIAPATFASVAPTVRTNPVTQNQSPAMESSSYSQSVESVQSENEPVGELTPIRPASTARMASAEPMAMANEMTASMPTTSPTAPKNNTMLYVLGAVVIGGGIYLATKKST